MSLQGVLKRCGSQRGVEVEASMYGLVNKAVEDLVVSRFGEPTWDAIKPLAFRLWNMR